MILNPVFVYMILLLQQSKMKVKYNASPDVQSEESGEASPAIMKGEKKKLDKK